MNQPKDAQPGQGPQAGASSAESGADPNTGDWQLPPYGNPYGAGPTGMPPWGWPHGQVPPEHVQQAYAQHAAYHAQPGHGWYAPPPGYGPPPYPGVTPGASPGIGANDPAMAGFTAAMGDIAEKNGLGMFKDFLNFDDSEFWKGALVGAAVILLFTNEELRNSLIGGAAKTAEAFKAGLGGEDESTDTDDGNETDNENLTEENA